MNAPLRSSKEPPDYLSYLLRLWRVSEDKTVWRASLESSYTGERKGFADINDLFDFLQAQISTPAGGEPDLIDQDSAVEKRR